MYTYIYMYRYMYIYRYIGMHVYELQQPKFLKYSRCSLSLKCSCMPATPTFGKLKQKYNEFWGIRGLNQVQGEPKESSPQNPTHNNKIIVPLMYSTNRLYLKSRSRFVCLSPREQL